MLNNEPRCFRSVLADCLYVRPTKFVDDLSEPLCIPGVHCFHAWNIAAAKLAGIGQFLPNSHVFGAHRQQFLTQSITQHLRNPLSGCSSLRNRSRVAKGLPILSVLLSR